jgi:hypothetical protein
MQAKMSLTTSRSNFASNCEQSCRQHQHHELALLLLRCAAIAAAPAAAAAVTAEALRPPLPQTFSKHNT